MSIIIEGPDNSGKSTLANSIAKQLGIEVIHAGSAPKTMEECFERLHSEQRLWCTPEIVQDRSFFISNFIYSKCIPSRSVDFDVRLQSNLLRTYVENFATTVIFCDAPNELLLQDQLHIVKAYDTPEHLEEVKNSNLQIIKEYRTLNYAFSLQFPTLTVNVRQSKDLDTLVGDLITNLGLQL